MMELSESINQKAKLLQSKGMTVDFADSTKTFYKEKYKHKISLYVINCEAVDVIGEIKDQLIDIYRKRVLKSLIDNEFDTFIQKLNKSSKKTNISDLDIDDFKNICWKYVRSKNLKLKFNSDWWYEIDDDVPPIEFASIFLHDETEITKFLDILLSTKLKVPSEYIGIKINVMTKFMQEAYNNQTLKKAQIRSVNKLPFNKFRYKVWISSSDKLPKDSKLAIYHHLSEGYRQNTVRLSAPFWAIVKNTVDFEKKRRIRHYWTNSANLYFYTEDIDIISIIHLIDFRFVIRVEEFIVKTTEGKK